MKPSRNTAARELGQKMSDFERGSEQVLKPSRNTAAGEPGQKMSDLERGSEQVFGALSTGT